MSHRLNRTITSRTSALPALVLGLIILLPDSQAATLRLVPATSEVTPGAVVSLDLVVADLTDTSAPSLAAFDLMLSFDPAVLSYVSHSLGDELGDLSTFEALDLSLGEVMPGGLNLAEVSLLTAAELDASQPGTFALATIDFMVDSLGIGESTVVAIFPVFGLADGNNAPIPVTGVDDATLTGAVVPLPGAVWLFASALMALGVGAQRQSIARITAGGCSPV